MSGESITFATGAARTMFAALYGSLTLHPPSSAVERTQDAYSLFYARSAAMGWLSSSANPAGGFWGMNDASSGPGSGPYPSCVARFQVAVTGLTPGGLLPIQPFLACIQDVIDCLGVLRLSEFQILIPERDRPLDEQPVSPVLAEGLNWFMDCPPEHRRSVRVTLDGGPDPSIRSAASAFLERFRGTHGHMFSCNSFSLDQEAQLVLWPSPFDKGVSNTAHHSVTLHGTLADWSLAGLGYMAALLADASSRMDITTPLMLTADQTG